MQGKVKQPSLFQAFIPIFFLIVFLSLNVYFFGENTLSGANQIALLLAAAIGGIIAVHLGHKWLDVRKKIVSTISSAMPSILILLLIGSLAGTWLLSGVVPALIYYGLKILHPSIFLAATVVICSLVSLATGSSWSTVATIGVALLGIGNALGFNEGVVAGAIISGAYFGDKMSPLSDTTNLAPAMAGTDLFTHIRYMVFTTAPSIVITLVIFFFLGLTHKSGIVNTDIQYTLDAISSTFNITPMLFLVPIILITIIVKKMPPLPAILIGTLLGALFAIIFQPNIIRQVSGITGSYIMASYVAAMQSMFGDISVTTDVAEVNDLLSTRGMAGMLNTIWLIISAMIFGGVMESAGLLVRITQSVIKLAKSTGSLVATTVGTCLFFNITASDQYISIVVPGRMFSKTFRERGLKPEVLSRTLEDSGTVTSVLIPWNTCGATQSAVLGVPVLSYLPYAFFNIISPLMSIFMAAFNIKIRRFVEGEEPESDEVDVEKE
ncbi:MAG TPA: Na+/H+ antiporter NhaC [Tenuifilaceae bacterium]|nr:Na+/H+ antiporter NhaC [Tenuifilaceae bacterium]HPE17557.1 Na+/H+ antiporter NhaC [Tenuifilaceae bacterium]HPJ45801.1 Na+/H+ antiporter NhaC [Tenuifilaceae bacterium]HPQ33995.1 Na+/H+ antiporter NhaC [Tenuifilaceae bacterium]HRX68154.1 Na+/H+ antiporter NhaC [Tenuifilaceae bacterium]